MRSIIWMKQDNMPEPEPITPNETRELYQRAFKIINQKMFNDELPPIPIDFIEGNKAKTLNNVLASFGYYSEGDPEPIIILDLQGTPEMGISTDTIDDLFHEMTHYYCFLHGIKDTDGKDCKYHNLAFKKAIEDHGGSCKFSDNEIGYSDTKLNKTILFEIFNEI